MSGRLFFALHGKAGARWLLITGVGVEKLFSGNFTSKIRSQVIECSFSADAEIDRNYCFGSFFNSHRRLTHNTVHLEPCDCGQVGYFRGGYNADPTFALTPPQLAY
jgi:hypothetical protein